MKVVYFHQYFVTPDMAGGTRSYEFARRLVEDGHVVHMITSDRVGGSRRTELIEGIHVTWIPVRYSNSMSVFRRIWAFLAYAVLAAFAGVRARPTVVFATSTPLTVIIPAILTKAFWRVPLVFEVRDLWPEMPIAIGALKHPALIRLATWMEKLAYFSSRYVIALSPGMKEGVVATGYPESRVVVIPNSSDIDRFKVDKSVGEFWLQQQSWYRSGPLVLYAGTLGELNDVGSLVDVAVAAREAGSDLQFLVVGDGKTRGAIEQDAIAKGVLGANFHMLPKMAKQLMPEVYSAATICLSLFQNLKQMERNSANKFFDALAAGKPVAINYGGWHETLIEEWQCGIRLSRDPSVASAQLIEFALRIEESPEFGRNSLRLAQSEFDRNKLYRLFEGVLVGATDSSVTTLESAM